MNDPLSSEPALPPTTDTSLRLHCPACTQELILEPEHLGLEGPCPACTVLIVARADEAGSITVQLLRDAAPPKDATSPEESVPSTSSERSVPAASTSPSNSSAHLTPALESPSPPLASAGGTVLRTKSGIFVEARRLHRRPSPVLLGLIALVLIAGFTAAAAISLRRSGNLFDFRRPVIVVPVPIPAAAVPMNPPPMEEAVPIVEKPAPALAESSLPESVPAKVAAPPSPTPPAAKPVPPDSVPSDSAPDDAQKAVLGAAANKALRDFLNSERPWEKLRHVLEPEEDLLSILEYRDDNPIAPDASVASWEPIRVAAARRWVSVGTLVERDGSKHTVCLVHQDSDGTAKLDFSLYWQNRKDRLTPFVQGPPVDRPLTLRVLLRQIPGEPNRFEIRQAFATFPPVTLSLPAEDPLLAELQGRTSLDAPTRAVIELVWKPSAAEAATAGTDPAQRTPTIAKLVRWELWTR
jgi:hypothetical protein